MRWSGTCVLPQVLFEVSEVVELLVAVDADVDLLLLPVGLLLRLEVVGVEVLLERPLPRVGPAAVLADEGLLQAGRVRLHVLLQVVEELEAALALIAPEHVVQLGDLDLHHLHALQGFGGHHGLLLQDHLLALPHQVRGLLALPVLAGDVGQKSQSRVVGGLRGGAAGHGQDTVVTHRPGGSVR